MKTLVHPKDKYSMNWVESCREWGTVLCPPSLSFETQSNTCGDTILESYVFTNQTEKPVFIQRGDISIVATFHDNCDR
ncbi:MAG: hypothetical protein LBM69_03955, partial [Lachnospiraceae bacterium]|nr:hypothetical protein [Lachnospiraceae bacterium]